MVSDNVAVQSPGTETIVATASGLQIIPDYRASYNDYSDVETVAEIVLCSDDGNTSSDYSVLLISLMRRISMDGSIFKRI